MSNMRRGFSSGGSGGTSSMEHVRGVFSTQEIRKIGTGTTTRKTVQKCFWFMEQQSDDVIECQPLNSNYIPSGTKRSITVQELLEKFSPEPEFYHSSVFPKMQEMQHAIDDGDTHREKGENFSAEYAYSTALSFDEENVRANFGIGLTYMQRGEKGKAQDIFERLVKLDAAFEQEHKHLFNEFGMNLRKNKMLEQAVDYYRRALELAASDENLHINLARTLLEAKDYGACTEHIMKALSLAPQHDTAVKFLQWLFSKNLVPNELVVQARECLQPPKKAVEPPEFDNMALDGTVSDAAVASISLDVSETASTETTATAQNVVAPIE